MASDQWRVAIGEKQNGPFETGQLRDRIAQGKMPANALVWKPGMAEWASWRDVPELAGAAAAASPGPASVMTAIPVAAAPARETSYSSYQGTTLSDYLTFRAMITPIFIQVIFWLGVAAIVVMALIAMIAGISNGEAGIAILYGLLTIVVGPVVWRIYCELLIVFFRMLDMLREINNKMKP